MQYLSPIYVIPHLFGHKMEIQLKHFLFCKKKSLRIRYFRNHNAHTSPLFRESNILKLPNKVTVENSLFINKYFNTSPLTILNIWFTPSSDFHTLKTYGFNLGSLVVPPYSTKIYGRAQ